MSALGNDGGVGNDSYSDIVHVSGGDAPGYEDFARQQGGRRKWFIAGAVTGVVILVVVIVIAVAASKSNSSSSSGGGGKIWENIRLPTGYSADTYTVRVEPDFNTFEFSGTVNFTFSTTNPTKTLLIHASNMNISTVLLKSGGKDIVPKNFHLYAPNEFLVIELGKTLAAGSHQLNIAYRGYLGDNLQGFYRSSYKNEQGDTVWLASTQFEATYARQAFPCFDEPAMKAKFNIELVVDSVSKTVLSNMPEKSRVPVTGGRTLVTFDETVDMSTYLVAFVVCDFAYKEMDTPAGPFPTKKVRVFAPPEKIDQVDVALDAAAKILAYYETFFNVSYPLPKSDLIAVPDFSAGAMENWGLITFRETALLYDEKVSAASNKQRVVVVVAHELAHQWFGNLVTMEWWTDLWLNEGFASFTEYIGTDHVYPSWQMNQQFVMTDVYNALTLDSTSASHPILQVVDDPASISELFDSISYDKGACIIKMMEAFLGTEDFLKGLNAYLRAHAFGNARSTALWDAMSAASSEGLDVASIMDTWTLQAGYPLMKVTLGGDQKTLTITGNQERFVTTEGVSPEGKWSVHLVARSTNSANPVSGWLYTNQNTHTLTLANALPADGWYKLNLNSTGYYRTEYPLSNWNALVAAMKAGDALLTSRDKQGLMMDAFALADNGKLPYHVPLNMTLSLTTETDYSVWTAGRMALSKLQHLLQDTAGFLSFVEYSNSIRQARYAALGWDNTGSHTEKLLRASILHDAVEFELGDSVAHAEAEFAKFQANQSYYINPDARPAVMYVGMSRGGLTEFNFIYDLYKQTQVPSEARMYLAALAATRVRYLLVLLMEYATDKVHIKSQDVSIVTGYIARNPFGPSVAWEFIRTNWDHLQAEFGANGERSFSSMVSRVLGGFTSQQAYNQAKAFLDTKTVETGGAAVANAVEQIRLRSEWLQTYSAPVLQWFKEHAP